MNFRAILFDLDGTLLDTLADIAESANQVLAARGCATHPIDAYRDFIGDGVVHLFGRALPEDRRGEEIVAECVSSFRERYAEIWNVRTRPYEGVAELLDAVTARGLKMAILSNKPHAFTRRCADAYFSAWPFQAVLGQRDGVPRKPDPAGALLLAEELGVEPGECVYLGDSGSDMQTAVAAGMYPAGALWGFRTAEELTAAGAKTLLERPGELLDLL